MSDSPEPSWLNGPPEPPQSSYSGTCPQCNTLHFNGRDEGFETKECSCGEVAFCEECEAAPCEECGDPVCPQCSATVGTGKDELRMCSGCYIEHLKDMATAVQSPEQYHSPAVHPIFLPVLEGFHQSAIAALDAASPMQPFTVIGIDENQIVFAEHVEAVDQYAAIAQAAAKRADDDEVIGAIRGYHQLLEVGCEGLGYTAVCADLRTGAVV